LEYITNALPYALGRPIFKVVRCLLFFQIDVIGAGNTPAHPCYWDLFHDLTKMIRIWPGKWYQGASLAVFRPYVLVLSGCLILYPKTKKTDREEAVFNVYKNDLGYGTQDYNTTKAPGPKGAFSSSRFVLFL
jgi:hypothetical protein